MMPFGGNPLTDIAKIRRVSMVTAMVNSMADPISLGGLIPIMPSLVPGDD
jgi:hypothetical protein